MGDILALSRIPPDATERKGETERQGKNAVANSIVLPDAFQGREKLKSRGCVACTEMMATLSRHMEIPGVCGGADTHSMCMISSTPSQDNSPLAATVRILCGIWRRGPPTKRFRTTAAFARATTAGGGRFSSSARRHFLSHDTARRDPTTAPVAAAATAKAEEAMRNAYVCTRA